MSSSWAKEIHSRAVDSGGQNTEQPSSSWSGWIEVAAIERTKRTTVVNEFIFVPTPHHHRPEVPSTTQLAPLFSQRRRRRWTNKWMNERSRSADCINFQTWLICFYAYLKLSSLLIWNWSWGRRCLSVEGGGLFHANIANHSSSIVIMRTLSLHQFHMFIWLVHCHKVRNCQRAI